MCQCLERILQDEIEDVFIVADDLIDAVDSGTYFLQNHNNINVFKRSDYFKKEDGLNILNTNTRDSVRGVNVIEKINNY